MKTLKREFKTFFVPDKDDFDFGRGALNNGGCILVSVAIENLPVDLKGYKNIEITHTVFKYPVSSVYLSPEPPWSIISYLQQLVPHNHTSVSAGRPVGVYSHHKHTHAGAVPVPGQAEAQACLAFLQLDHVQDTWEAAIALDYVLWKEADERQSRLM